MSKNITVKYGHLKMPSSKQMILQVEFSTNTSMKLVKQFLCGISNNIESEFNVNEYPHQAAQLAYFISQIRQNCIFIKTKKENPIQIDFSVDSGLFILSISFLSDNAALRQICKLVTDKIYDKRNEQAYKLLYKQAKQFCKDYDKQVLQDSMMSMISDSRIYLFSKNEDQTMNQILEKVVQNINQKEIKQHPNKYPGKDLPQDGYISFDQSKKQIGALGFYMLLAGLNMQNIDYITRGDRLFILGGQIKHKTKDNCLKFIKHRLSYTDPKKIKHYKDLKADQKKKYSEAEFKKKQDIQLKKKIYLILQVIFSSGVCSVAYLNQIHKELLQISHKNVESLLEIIKHLLADMTKKK